MDLGFGPGRKSPSLARWLSIIPGLGHLYAGEYFAGIIWLLLSFPLMFMLGLPFIFVYGFRAFRPSLFFLFCYGFVVVWCAREASRNVADQNARKAAQEKYASLKQEKKEFEKLQVEARKRLE